MRKAEVGYWFGWRGVLLSLALLGVACGKSDQTGPSAGSRSSSSSTSTAPDAISESAQRQIAALLREKATRSPALEKVDSQLVYALKMQRGEAIAPGVERLETSVEIDTDGFVTVEIDVRDVSPVLAGVKSIGGEVLTSSERFGGVSARVPLVSLETLAALPAVKFVRELRQPVLNREALPVRGKAALEPIQRGERLERAFPTRTAFAEALREVERRHAELPRRGANAVGPQTQVINGSAGVTTHRANVAHASFNARGQGIKVGVLSDSVDFLAQVQATGDLPAVTVLPGQSGVGPGSTGEGTAMLEIVHDMAPNATLYFATAFGGVASFASNIVSLRSAGCDVIVDDVFYYNEAPFQDGPIAQAVNFVTADGAIYLSSAGNAGSLLKGTSGVYEGNFVATGTPIGVLAGLGTVNQFNNGVTSLNNNRVAATNGGAPVTLFWSDPLGASSNDYDLFILNTTLNMVVNSSTNVQTGSQDPYEQSGISPSAGRRLVVVKKAGAQDRYLHLNTNRGLVDIPTAGQTKGHAAALAAFSVAATPAATAFGAGSPTGPYPGSFSAANQLETFSSDGLRRVFYNANGTLANGMNSSLLGDGGVVRQKPDITAADGVATATPGFDPFYGTSAAAPHAAGIVAQMKSVSPGATPAQLRAALAASAFDIEGAGTDANAGAGIVMSDRAVSSILGVPNLALGTVSVTPTNGSDAALDPGEHATLLVQLTNSFGGTATSLSGTLGSTTPGVTITQPGSAYPNIPVGGNGTNVTPFEITLAPSFPCGSAVSLTLTASFAGGSPLTFAFEVQTGTPGGTPVTFPYAGPVVPIPDGLSGTAQGPMALATMTVPTQVSRLSDVDFTLTGTNATSGAGLTHSWVGDLVVRLTSPSGTTIRLINRLNNGAGSQSADNFFQTLLDDAAASPIQAATVGPFTGSFRPAEPLSAFANEDPSGTWTVSAVDYVATDAGAIRAFSLTLTGRQCTPLLDLGTGCGAGSECSTGNCVDGVCCDDPCGGNNATDCQACNGAGHCGAAPSATVCRPAANGCDTAETCGGNSVCPADAAAPSTTPCGAGPSGACDAQDTCSGGVGATATCVPRLVPASTQCRPSAGGCDVAEACTGLSPDCPNDVVVSAGSQCRASAGACDLAETCDGSSPACPNDASQPAGTPCGATPSGLCDAQDTCSGGLGSSATCVPKYLPASTPCRPSAGACDVAESCTGSQPECPSDVLITAGSQCRASAGACDSAEACDGQHVNCPADGRVAQGTQCRASAGACDSAEACDGSGIDCPADARVPAGTECRASLGTCDLAEACDGAGVACPSDAAAPAGTPCGTAPSGLCDAQDTCSGGVGASATCVPKYQPAATVCRTSGGACDVAETCSGTAPDCPLDVLIGAGNACRPSAGACDLAEACTGQSPTCPNDARVPQGTECRASLGTCDPAEACDGSAVACPADAAAPVGTACGGAPSGLCDAQDTCAGTVGSTATCVANYQSAATVCRSSAGSCDIAESCTGAAPDCPGDILVGVGTECRAAGGVCDVAEACTGQSPACPADLKVPQGSICRPVQATCDQAEACDGSAVACPADSAQPVGTACGGAPSGQCDAQDTCAGTVGATSLCVANYQPSSVVCRSSAGSCDVSESCTGAAANCPTDTLVPQGTECRASVGACDAAEACDGTHPTCATDAALPAGTPCGGSPNGQCDAQDTCAGSIGAQATCVQNYQPSSVVCRPSGGSCDVAESCTGAAANCPTDVHVSAGTVCRPSVGACDLAEACDGSSPGCSADAAEPVGTACGGSPSGVCDAQDTCAGTVGAQATCVANFQPTASVCRAAAGACDVAESCTGNATSCPTDVLVSAGTQCRAVVGDCDVAEACTGSAPACPADVLVSTGTVCRAAAGPCDVAEACDGSHPSCAADAAEPVGAPCGGSPSGVCDAQDTCAGTVGAQASCAANFQPSATVCRAAVSGCDVAESCTGSTTTCPADALAAQGASCSDGTACTAGDACDGSGACTPGAAVACDDHNPCTADSCDPGQGCVEAPLADGSACSDDSACTTGDSCQGATCRGGDAIDCDDANPCTVNSCDTVLGCRHLAATSGTSCDDANACTAGDSCDGAGTCSAGPALDCDDGNECTADDCRPTGGCRHRGLDGSSCSGGEGMCVGTTCTLQPEGGAGEPGTGGASGRAGNAGRAGAGDAGRAGRGAGGGTSAAAGEGGEGGETVGTEGGAAGEAGHGAGGKPPTVTHHGGCGCRLGADDGPTSHGWLAALALATVVARRRARRSAELSSSSRRT